jgi:hypothetical protein
MMEKMIAVRFLVFHGGFPAEAGEVLEVSAEWAKAAIASGVVEEVESDVHRDSSSDAADLGAGEP